MFPKEVYKKRRNALRKEVKSGILLFLGNQDVAFNYPSNIYPFRQDSSFSYFFGIDQPNLVGIIDIESGDDFIFGDELSIDDIIWMGKLPTIKDLAAQVGITSVIEMSSLKQTLSASVSSNRPIHFLPPYRGETKHQLESLLGVKFDRTNDYASIELVQAVIKLRSIKDSYEVAEIEKMVDVAYEMHTTAMKMAKPGVLEQEIMGEITGVTFGHEGPLSFPAIVTINGQTLHNNYYRNKLADGRMLVVDAGAESLLHYASDITRTTPVGGKFNQRQKEIYEIVLKANMSVIDELKPNIRYKDMHLLSAKIIVDGLKDLGIMKGDTEEAVAAGAHALFYPHGLGHMMGLDVHDMEGLGENNVGYDAQTQRSEQFGLAFLRLGKKLDPGFVITVEPGIYFIPDLIDMWKNENKFTQFINYEKVETYKDFGGIRIEDDLLITDNSHRVLGKPIPKTVAEVEEICAK